MKTVLSIIFTLAVLAVGSFAQAPGDAKPSSPTYDELLAKLRSGDTKVDFKALRFAYAESKDFNPMGGPRELRAKMVKAFNDKKFKEVAELGTLVLKANYLEIETHMMMAMATRELGDEKKSTLHEAIYVGLVNSILSDGDGNSTKTAYKVISVAEESAVVRALELQRGTQAPLEEDGHRYNVMSVTDPKTKEQQRIYFNVDAVWKAAMKLRKP